MISIFQTTREMVDSVFTLLYRKTIMFEAYKSKVMTPFLLGLLGVTTLEYL